MDGKDLTLWASLLIVGLLVGLGIGFVLGAWGGTINGYDDGVNAGIEYANCVLEETPLYGEVTQESVDKCFEMNVYG